MAEYDPLKYETWPDEQKDFAGRVWRGLLDGDLAPLAKYLRAGHHLDQEQSDILAGMIEHDEDALFHIRVKGRKQGQRPWTALIDSHEEKMLIGVYVEEQLRSAPKGQYDAVIKEAAEKKFKVGTTRVKDCLAYMRKTMAEADTAPGLDTWEVYRKFYSG